MKLHHAAANTETLTYPQRRAESFRPSSAPRMPRAAHGHRSVQRTAGGAAAPDAECSSVSRCCRPTRDGAVVNSAIDVVQHLREMAETRGVDVARLELVLVNLISNAIKYSDPRKPKRSSKSIWHRATERMSAPYKFVITALAFRIRSRSSTISIVDMPVATASWGTADSGWACPSSTIASAL